MASRNPEERFGPLEKGRNRYQQKNYEEALEAFADAVKQSSGHLKFTALDHRAATYEKLDQLQAALRDSKQMIDLKPELAKGYLRCGKVLQLKGEKELAMKIYERGLMKVKIGTDDNRTKLQSMFNKLRHAQNPEKTRDPLQYLPLELAEMVVQNLGMSDRVICLAVSKPWKRLLESSSKLWTTFDTSRVRKPINKTSLRLHLRRSNYTLDHAIINSRSQFDAKKLTYLTKACKKLTYLTFNGSGIIGDSLVMALPFAQNLTSITVSSGYQISMSTVVSALTACQKTLVDATFLRVIGGLVARDGPTEWPTLEALKSLRIHCFPNLRRADWPRPSLEISLFLKAGPSLRSISCHGIQIAGSVDLSHFEVDDIKFTETSLESLPILPLSIKNLDVSNNLYLSPTLDLDHSPDFPLLESFSCEGTSLLGEAVKDITSSSIKAGNLKKLFVGCRFADKGRSVIADEYPPSSTLEELSLRYLQLTEKRIIDIVGLYPNIRRLNVSSTKISGVAVKHFVEIGIKWLAVNECPNISPDAVEFARGRGVEVEFNFPSRWQGKAYRDSVAF